MAENLRIREAREADVKRLYALIVELATYEKLGDQVNGDAERLRRSLFEVKSAEALIAESDGEIIGYAIICGSFSTFECEAGIWIEDIYVRPASREGGVGRALFARVAALALERGCPRIEWAALEWNQLALDFYDGLGAQRLEQWRMLRLEGDDLARLGGET